MVKARKYVVKKYFEGLPKKSDFELVEYELPPLKDGEILLKTEWVSVDPYLQFYNSSMPVPYDQFSSQVGIVEESKNPNYPVGTRVVTHNGWCDYSIVDDEKLASLNPPEILFTFSYKLPNLEGFSPSVAIGAAGMPGVTAYYAILEGCQPKAGETVVVTGAAGAVGSVAGQIAKMKGCKVIGFAGSDDKVKWLEEELGFDKAFNYKTTDVQAVLKTAAPEGVDCYFDNVGGEISKVIIAQMNRYGRVCVVGSISSYSENPNKIPKVTISQPSIVAKELKIHEFGVASYIDRWQEAVAQLITWIKDGKLKPKEHVTFGFDKLCDAFIGMLTGENIGKAVVKI